MKKIIRFILLFILLAVIALAVWQRENLVILWNVAFSDSEAVAQQLEQVSAENEKILREQYHVNMPSLSREQTDELLSGAKSQQMILQELGIDQAATSEPKDAAGITEKYTAQLSAYRVELMTQLGGLKQELLNRWTALAPEERTSAEKSDLIREALHRCYTLEAQSDEHVKSLLDQLSQELKAIGADTSVRDVLWKQYAAEKAAEKTYYFKNYIG